MNLRHPDHEAGMLPLDFAISFFPQHIRHFHFIILHFVSLKTTDAGTTLSIQTKVTTEENYQLEADGMNQRNNRNEEKIKYHKYIVTCIGGTVDGFGLEIGFTGLFVTKITELYNSLSHTLVSTSTSSLPLHGSGFNGGRSTSSGSRTNHVPQLPASNTNSSQRLSPNSSLTH